MTLYDDLKADIADCLFDGDLADTPTETVVYRKANGTTRTIRAFVERAPAEPYGNAAAAVISCQVINSATLGIASTEINTGTDSIEVAERAGLAAVARRIHRIVEHNAAVLKLEVR